MEDITYIKGYNMKLRATKQEKKTTDAGLYDVSYTHALQ